VLPLLGENVLEHDRDLGEAEMDTIKDDDCSEEFEREESGEGLEMMDESCSLRGFVRQRQA
jgi:hypothetical protein